VIRDVNTPPDFFFVFSSAFFRSAATSAHNRVNAFCSSAGSLANARLTKFPHSVELFAE
jgi:hypothetical protein